MPQYASGSGMKEGTGPVLLNSATETASTTGGNVSLDPSVQVTLITLAVTAVSGGAPTMTVVIEGSNDLTNWVTIATLGANGDAQGAAAAAPTNITAPVTLRAVCPALQYMRSRSVIGGTTPSFTYSVTAE